MEINQVPLILMFVLYEYVKAFHFRASWLFFDDGEHHDGHYSFDRCDIRYM